jgi:hypothetical protein
MRATLSRRRPASALRAPWQEKQRDLRVGRTSERKSARESPVARRRQREARPREDIGYTIRWRVEGFENYEVRSEK